MCLCDLLELVQSAVECFRSDIAVECLLEADFGWLSIDIHPHDLIQIEGGLLLTPPLPRLLRSQFIFILFGFGVNILGFYLLFIVLSLLLWKELSLASSSRLPL